MSIYKRISVITAIMLPLLFIHAEASAHGWSSGRCAGTKPSSVEPPIKYRPDDGANPMCPSKQTKVAGTMTCAPGGSGTQCKTYEVAVPIFSAKYSYSSSEGTCNITSLEESGVYIASSCSER